MQGEWSTNVAAYAASAVSLPSVHQPLCLPSVPPSFLLQELGCAILSAWPALQVTSW